MIAPIDVTGICIETERLFLRPWKSSDLRDFYEYASVDGVGQMAGWLPHKSIEETKKILDMFITEKKTLALVLKDNGKVIGSVGFEDMDPDPIEEAAYGREIGYVLGKDYWGKGLMTEAVKAVIVHCFEVLGYDYLTCGHFLRNDRSQRIIEKCGFCFFGETNYETRYDTIEVSKNYILHNPRSEVKYV